MARGAGLIPKFKNSDIKKHLLGAAALLDAAIIMRFSYIGEQFVANARNNGSYIDQTGNLRSSIGYIVLKNGTRVAGSNFPSVGKGGEGSKVGKSLIAELRTQYSTGYALIVVAGMDYAAAVESRGRDVLTGSSQIAKDDLQSAIQSFKEKISGKKNG